MKYDFLIVGAGLYGSVFAREMTQRGKRCLVIEQRDHIGGNCYTKEERGIHKHVYGPHIFHTSDRKVWDYVNSFVLFNRFTNTPVAQTAEGKLYNLPFNMNTFYQLWGTKTPAEAEKIIERQRKEIVTPPKNLEEQSISLVGRDIYELLIKGYTEKQWGRECKDLPAFIIKRLPVRFIYDNNYFNDLYQGIPIGGYTTLFHRLLEGIEVRLNTDFFEERQELLRAADHIIYSGQIDRFFDYRLGRLAYRSLRFEDTLFLNTSNYQGSAIVNYVDREVPYTRTIEHKHFDFGTQPDTIITKEYPQEWTEGGEPYYPINNDKNQERYAQYAKLAQQEQKVIFAGRLAEYKYYDMHQVVAGALRQVKAML